MNMMKEAVAPMVFLLGLSVIDVAAAGARSSPLEVGTLSCAVEGSSGSIFGGSRDVRCEFTSALNADVRAQYEGTISNVGLNFGSHRVTSLSWGVFAPVGAEAGSALGGTYLGTAASGSVGVGFGGNLLFNVSGDGITLQPLSVQFQTGLNASLGAVELQLNPSLDDEVSQLNAGIEWDADVAKGG